MVNLDRGPESVDVLERVRAVARQGTTILLVTHHVDEIIPEIARVILLRAGRIVCDGAKAGVLAATHLSDAFDAAVSVEQSGGYFHVRVSETGPLRRDL